MVLELALAALFGAALALGVVRLDRWRRSRSRLFGTDDRGRPLLDGPSHSSSSIGWRIPRAALITRIAEMEQQNVELIGRCQSYERQAMALASQLETAKAELAAVKATVPVAPASSRSLHSIAGDEPERSERLSHTGPIGDVAENGTSFSSSSATQIETDRLVETATMGGGGQDASLSVQVDNRRDDKATLVRVIVSNRVGLLAEMSAVLAGLGLSVITAAVATDEETGRATNDFYVQEHGRKVFGRSRLATIENRIQQWGRSGWLRDGMQRLIDKALISPQQYRITPPSPLISRQAIPVRNADTSGRSLLHQSSTLSATSSTGPVSHASGFSKVTSQGSIATWGVMGTTNSVSPAADGIESSLLNALTHALRGGALPFGALHATLAADLAATALAQMSVCEMPPGTTLKSNHGEWMLLVESGDATVITEGADPDDLASGESSPTAAPPATASRLNAGPPAKQPVQRRPTRAMTLRADYLSAPGAALAPDLGGGVGAGVGALFAQELAPKTAVPHAEAETAGTTRTSLPPCSLLWEVVVLPGEPSSPSRSAAGGRPGSSMSWTSALSNPCAEAAVRWLELSSRTGAVLRVMHRTELRNLLVSTRERSARQHFRLLHELPVLAPLPPSTLLSLCRRATDIELPPSTTVLPVAQRDAHFRSDPVASILTDSTFAIVLAGELVIHFDPNAAEEASVGQVAPTPHSGHHWDQASHAPKSNTMGTTPPFSAALPPRAQSQGARLPVMPIFRLGVRDTLGEAGALHGATPPPGVTITTGPGGARLLCWPRDSSLAEALSRLPDLLPGSWRSRSYLGFLVEAPALARKLVEMRAIKPLGPHEICELEGRRMRNKEVPPPSLCVVTQGTLIEHLPVKVKLTPIQSSPEASARPLAGEGGATPPPSSPMTQALDGGQIDPGVLTPQAAGTSSWRRAARRFELNVRVHSRHRLLADLTSIIHNLGLEVHSARIATEAAAAGGELANDTFAVTPRGATAALDTESLVRRITNQLSEVLTIHPLHAGDATASSIDGHRLRMPPHAEEPPAALKVDLVAAAAALAAESGRPPFVPEEVAQSGIGALFRTLLMARHPLLAAQLGAAGDTPPLPREAPKRVGRSAEWLLAFSELCLYLQREAAGQGEEGMRMEDLVSELTLGEGASGTVRLARHRFSGRIYAVKIFDKARLAKGQNGRALLRYIEREREVLQLLSTKLRGDKTSAHMVRYVCSGQDGPTLRLVMPACLGGELWNVLAEFGAMSEAEARFYAGCLTLALQKLHAIGVVYRDLKPENVLLSHTGWPVIADFGLATVGSLDDRPLYSMCGTPEFMAPEVVRSLGYGPSADWWSLGVLICQCLTLATPFADPHGRAQMTFSNIVRGRVTAERSQHYRMVCSTHAVSLLDALLQPEPSKRLGDTRRDAGRIRVHPFFWGLDWQALEERRLTPPHADFCAHTAEKLLASHHTAPPERAGEGMELTAEQQQLFAHW